MLSDEDRKLIQQLRDALELIDDHIDRATHCNDHAKTAAAGKE